MLDLLFPSRRGMKTQREDLGHGDTETTGFPVAPSLLPLVPLLRASVPLWFFFFLTQSHSTFIIFCTIPRELWKGGGYADFTECGGP
jgi:hypothetical protein